MDTKTLIIEKNDIDVYRFNDVEIQSTILTRASSDVEITERVKQSVTYNLNNDTLKNVIDHCVSSWDIKVQSKIRSGTLEEMNITKKENRTDEQIQTWMKKNPTLLFNTLIDFKPMKRGKTRLEKATSLVEQMSDGEKAKLLELLK